MPSPPDIARPSRTWPFFALALAITWVFQLPMAFAARGILPGPAERFALPSVIGTFGPLIAALIAARIEGSPARSVFASLKRPLALRWILIALGGLLVIQVMGWAMYRFLGGTSPGKWLYLPENSTQVAAMLLVPIAEEPGWRGFALPRLQRRMSPLAASLVLGAVWAAWHTMMFLFSGISAAMFAVSLANIVLGSVLFSWLFNRTGGSLLSALLLHVGAHLDNPTHALPAHPAPFVVYTTTVGVAAVGLILFDRRAWRRAAVTASLGVERPSSPP